MVYRKKKRNRRAGDASQLEMTPMIDVVFQLLIFFIVTLKVEDIMAHLDVIRPAPDKEVEEQEVEDLVTIQVYEDGYVLRGRRISKERLEQRLMRIAGYSKDITIVIKCKGTSPHKYLLQLLDICSKAGLKNLSVFSM
ncbi:MAG: ExbD/TolR family protein [Verrucomicrobiota bacterium]